MTWTDFVTFIAGVVLGALCSWFITHRYYLKASVDQQVELKKLADNLQPKNTLADFEKYLITSSWTKEFIENNVVWICDADGTFQIVYGEDSQEFKERWTTVYPDQDSQIFPVYMKISGTVIKELKFISLDGGRIFVPMTEIRPTKDNELEYFWNLNSLEVKICNVIGEYYIYKDLRSVAKFSKVTLVE